MVQKSVSLAVQLVLTLVGLVVVTTVVLTVVAYRSFQTNLDTNARRGVRSSAEQAARTLTTIVDRQQARAQGFLSSVDSLCGESSPSGRTHLESECVSLALSEYLATEHARGALLEYRGRRARAGAPTEPALGGPLARIVTGKSGFHTGVDIANDAGSPIRCTADGEISFAGWEGGYGKLVVVNHGNGFSTYYGHLSEIKAAVGQRIVRGQVLGNMGATGNTTGPHLHYEIRLYGASVDPTKYMED